MRRRQFIAGLGSAAAWPLAARAQQRAVPVVGVLLTQSADDDKIEIVAFLQSLKELGFVADENVAVEYRYAENQNVAIEYRYAGNQVDRLPALTAALLQRLLDAAGHAGS